MKKIFFILSVGIVLAGCSSVPDPKIPQGKYRSPINLTVPVELINKEAL